MNKTILIFSLVVLVFSCGGGITEPQVEQNRLIKHSVYEGSNDIQLATGIYSYDSLGQLASGNYDSNGGFYDGLIGYRTYQHDSANRLMRENVFNDSIDQTLIWYTEITYDSDNRDIRRSIYSNNGMLRSYIINEYSDDSLRRVRRFFNNRDESTSSNIYEFISVGLKRQNPTKITRCTLDNCTNAITFEYDSANRLIVKSNFEQNRYSTYEHDSANQPTRMNIYNSNNILLNYLILEYELSSQVSYLDVDRAITFWDFFLDTDKKQI